MTILASCDIFPSHMVISVFDEAANWIDSLYVNNFWIQEDIDEILKEAADEYGIKKWISSGERKIIERSNLMRNKHD